jgi:hypothetical protein
VTVGESEHPSVDCRVSACGSIVCGSVQESVCGCQSLGLRELPSDGRGAGASERQSQTICLSEHCLWKHPMLCGNVEHWSVEASECQSVSVKEIPSIWVCGSVEHRLKV